MFKNNLHIVLAGIVIGTIVLFLIFRPEPQFTVIEKKVGDLVYTDNYTLRVSAVKSLLGNVTQIDLAIRNLFREPIRFLVTDRADQSSDLHYKKYYFIIMWNGVVHSTCCQNHLVEPGDDTGRFDTDLGIYFSGHIALSDNCFLLVAEDPLGEDVVSKIKLTTN